MIQDPIVRFAGVSKVYANGTRALDDVSIAIGRGSIHAICGENGAGKSTLMKILFGLEQPTSGTLSVDGEIASIRSSKAAMLLGIGMVHQHFSLVPSLTVAENIVMGQEPRRGLFLDRKAASRRVTELGQHFNLHVAPDLRVADLSVAARQKVEILKALSRNVRILILDEPTAVLTPLETDDLFSRMQDLKAAGMTILFISHKLREVRALADHMSVLRGGRVAGDAPLAAVDDHHVARLVMGETFEARAPKRHRQKGSRVVELDAASYSDPASGDRLTGVNLVVHAGEIVGIAGVDGSGQKSLVALLSGRAAPKTGRVKLHGEVMNTQPTQAWRRSGLAHLPADRFQDGSAPDMSVAENAIAGAHRAQEISWGSFLISRKVADRAAMMIDRYKIKCDRPADRLALLSGGNAQKVVAAREFATSPTFLIVDQPTRGIDVAAAKLLHDRIAELAEQGVAVLLISADLDELLDLSDRVIVLFNGKVTAALENGPDLSPAHLGPFMLGLEIAL